MILAAEKASRRCAELWEGRSHCANGHELTEDSVVVRTRPGGLSRQCRECIRDGRRRTWARIKQDPDRLRQARDRARRAQAAYRARKENS